MQPSRPMPRVAVRGGVAEAGVREVAEEVAVAMVYNGAVHAVLMATPADLEDFGVGFSITEGIVSRAGAIRSVSIEAHADGFEVRMRLALGGRAGTERRRATVGGTGCGLCGVESLAEAVRLPPPVAGAFRPEPGEIASAMAALEQGQALGRATRAVHAAGFWTRAGGIAMVREDVGRHNALDKLVGGLARAGRDGRDGMVVLTSRVSVEMVQKTARLGAPVIAAVSAPTTLAVRVAEAAGVMLVGVVRGDGYEVFTRPGGPRHEMPAAAGPALVTPQHRSATASRTPSLRPE